MSAGLLPSYGIQTWTATPSGYPRTGVLVAKVTGLYTGANRTQATSVVIALDPLNAACSTPDKFLLDGQFWYAAYGSSTVRSTINSCCATRSP